MKVAGLLPILSRVSAPLLQTLLMGGPDSARKKIGERVVETLSHALDLDKTPEAILQAYEENPKKVTQTIERVEIEKREDWIALLEQTLHAQALQSQTLQAEHTAPSLLTRLWRPLFGLVYAVAFLALSLSLVWAVLLSDVEAINALASLSGLLIALYGMGASILGVYVWKRSDEKIKRGRGEG